MYDGICRPGRLDSVSLNIHIKLYLWLYDNTMYLHNKCAQKVAVCADKDVWYQCCRLIVLACCRHSSRGCYEWRGSLCQGPHSITPLPHPHCYIATFALAGTSTSRFIDIPCICDTFHTVNFNFLLLLHVRCGYSSWIFYWFQICLIMIVMWDVLPKNQYIWIYSFGIPCPCCKDIFCYFQGIQQVTLSDR